MSDETDETEVVFCCATVAQMPAPPTDGSERRQCRTCGTEVWLAAESMRLAAKYHPGVPVLVSCGGCEPMPDIGLLPEQVDRFLRDGVSPQVLVNTVAAMAVARPGERAEDVMAAVAADPLGPRAQEMGRALERATRQVAAVLITPRN